jgi:hypothetical protein
MRTHAYAYTHTNTGTIVGADDVEVPQPGGVTAYTPWPARRRLKKGEKAHAAKHNSGLALRIFEHVGKKKGDPAERKKFPYETLCWYAHEICQCDFADSVKDAHDARAEIRKFYKRGTNTVGLKEKGVRVEANVHTTLTGKMIRKRKRRAARIVDFNSTDEDSKQAKLYSAWQEKGM